MAKAFKGYEGLAAYAERIPEVIVRTTQEFEATLPEVSEAAHWALATTREYALRPSKRVRGSVAAAAYDQASGSRFGAAGLQLAAAIEALQNYLLIVDDVIDQSATRRGLPTVHELYKTAFSPEVREADMVGILVGLLPSQVANHIIATTPEAPERLLAVMRLVARDMVITDVAQIDDIQQQFGRVLEQHELLRKHEQKSSYYSFVNPLSCGLILGGIEQAQARADSEAYGLPAGVAFQLRDDYLGVFGTAGDTGKPQLDDLREGKYTLMVHCAEEAGTEEDRARLAELLGDPTAGEDELEAFREILRRTGADERAMALAREYADQAAAAAHAAASWDTAFADMLEGLVRFSVERNG